MILMGLCRKGSTVNDVASSIIVMIFQLLATLAVVYDVATIPNVQEASYLMNFLVVNILGTIGCIKIYQLFHALSKPNYKLTSNRYYAIGDLVLSYIFTGISMAFFITYFIYFFSNLMYFFSKIEIPSLEFVLC